MGVRPAVDGTYTTRRIRKMKRILSVFLALTLMAAGVVCARAEYYSDTAAAVGETVITPEELEGAMRLYQIQAALSSAALDYSYDVTDTLNIIDALSKVLFDMELQVVIRAQAEAKGIAALTAEEEKDAAARAESAWNAYKETAMSDAGMAHLPAADYTPSTDPDETVANYFAAWGLTKDALMQQAKDEILNEKLLRACAADMTDTDEDAVLDAYTEWLLGCWADAGVVEDAIGVAEVCLNLK